MRNWQIENNEPQEVAVLLFPRFSNHCLANAIEPFRAANDLLMRDFYRWKFVTLDGEAVESSSGMPVLPHCKLRDHAGGEYLFVMSSYDAKVHATLSTSQALKSAGRRFRNIVGLDTGAWLMAKAGLLDGRRSTIHLQELAGFAETFDGVEASEERFVIDGNRLSCGGAMTAFDLTLELIRRTHGEAMRLEISSFFLHQSTDAQAPRLFKKHESELINACIAFMSSRIEEPIPIADLASHFEITQRALTRLFQAELGAPPATVYKRIRLNAARRYAEQSTYPVSEIAVRCGYANPAAMTRAFVEQFGKPPSAFR